jgi:hypothetical protein
LLEVILFLFIVVAGTGGELCVSRAMKAVGEVKDFRPAAIARVIGRALRVGWMWAGVGLMALAFFSLLGALSILNVSFVEPAALGGCVFGLAGGHPGVPGESMNWFD